MTPFPPPAPIPTDEVNQLVGDRWRETHQTLIVALDKSQMKPKDTMRDLWKLCPDYNLVIVDQDVDIQNLSDVAWRTLGNVDWRRDALISTGEIDHYAPPDGKRGYIGIDATQKGEADGHPRGWPEEIFMSPEIVALVDKKWKQYGIK